MKRPLADVLWEAANERLSATNSFGWDGFSCCAVGFALDLSTWVEVLGHPATEFLDSLGCAVEESQGSVLDDFEEGIQRQGVRYMWLLLAMHVAEDEGIMVEVA